MSGEREEADREDLAQLLRRVGRRPDPPAMTREALYRSTLSAWEHAVQRRRLARGRAIALAAGVTVAVVAIAWMRGLMRDPPTIAASVAGGIGMPISVGQSLDTSRGQGLTLRTTHGDGLRLASGSRLRFDALDRLTLEAGRLYFESGARSDYEGLRIGTPYGEVRHVGTRYSVEVDKDRMRVRVRDGEVAVRTAAVRTTASAGTEISFDRRGRESRRRTIDTYGSAWLWADSLAPPVQIDARSLLAVLEEIASESGRKLEFADTRVRQECREIELKGPLLELSVGDRLLAVLVTTEFEAIENGDRILIRRRADAGTAQESTASR